MMKITEERTEQRVARLIDKKIGDMCQACMLEKHNPPYKVRLEDEAGARLDLLVGNPYPDVIGDRPLERIVVEDKRFIGSYGGRVQLTLPVTLTLSVDRQEWVEVVQES